MQLVHQSLCLHKKRTSQKESTVIKGCVTLDLLDLAVTLETIAHFTCSPKIQYLFKKKLFLRFYVPECHPNERASFWAKKTIFEVENLRKVKLIFYRFLWPKSGSVPFSRGKTVGTKILKKFQNKTSNFSYWLIFSQLSKPFFGRVIRLRRTVRYRRNRRRSATFWRLHVQFKVANLKKGVD